MDPIVSLMLSSIPVLAGAWLVMTIVRNNWEEYSTTIGEHFVQVRVHSDRSEVWIDEKKVGAAQSGWVRFEAGGVALDILTSHAGGPARIYADGELVVGKELTAEDDPLPESFSAYHHELQARRVAEGEVTQLTEKL